MKRIIAIFAVLCMAFFSTGCSKVPAGNVGVKVYLLGGDKGVDSEELGPGRYWVGINEELYIFPTFTQNYVWTKEPAEGSVNDESFKFQTIEGMTVGADIGISYMIQPDKVNDIFQKYRKGISEITDVYLRNMVRDALVIESSTMPIESVYGKGKADLIEAIQNRVSEQVETLGITVEKIYWVGELRLPEQVTAALNAKIQATQKAQQRENEIRQAEAEADIAREKARGEADAKILQAQAEAEAVRLKGIALKKNPEVLQQLAIEKWDGVLPRITGESAVPFIDVGKDMK
jgi:regulator of protease activity HflC (stomatin/prohibitin superfamily)